jgi:hypothetical protein
MDNGLFSKENIENTGKNNIPFLVKIQKID